MIMRQLGTWIFSAAAALLVVVSYLMTWWFVPAYRALGPQFMAEQPWYSGVGFFILWSMSGPLGAVVVVLGLGIASELGRGRLTLLVSGGVVLLAWLGLWGTRSQMPAVFGIGGGIILAGYLVAAWQWSRARLRASGDLRAAADLRMLGYTLSFVACWGLCGLLGSPIFGLRPALMVGFETEPLAISMGVKVITCLALAWIAFAAGGWLEARALRAAAPRIPEELPKPPAGREPSGVLDALLEERRTGR
jgi:hypothetical protein